LKGSMGAGKLFNDSPPGQFKLVSILLTISSSLWRKQSMKVLAI
jgi:hypothetical protein